MICCDILVLFVSHVDMFRGMTRRGIFGDFLRSRQKFFCKRYVLLLTFVFALLRTEEFLLQLIICHGIK